MPAQRKRHKSRPAAAPEPAVASAPVFRLAGTAVARHLTGGARSRAAVVISYKADADTRIDAAALAQLLDGEADIYELQNGGETRQLQDGLPEGLEIYGTGARVYPAGPAWPESTPEPRLVRPGINLARLMADLATDVRTAARRIHPAAPASPKTCGTTATGTVGSFAAEDTSRALVRLATTGELVTIRAEDLLPGVPLDWLLTRGQQVTGALDEQTHILDIRALLQRPGSPVTVYSPGDVALARVKTASETHAVVTLWPDADFRIGVEHISSNELDAAEDLLTEGEVVRVRVLYENGAVVLSMLDVDDDDPHVRAPSLVAGGPPWLDLDRPYASIFAPPAVSASAAAGGGGPWTVEGGGGAEDESGGGESGVVLAAGEPALTASERRTALKSTQMELEAARHTIAELLADATRRGATDKIARLWQDRFDGERRKADQLARQHLDAVRQLDAVKAELAKTKAKLVDARQQRRSSTSRSDVGTALLFTDPAEQFGHELRTEWARMVPAVDKAAEPLGEYTVGPHFLASLALLPAPQRTKVRRAVVDLVANREGPLRNRKPHLLRENEGAHAPARVRGDDTCWRLYVEQGTAAALRLHYWKLKSGGFELHEVVPHDEVRP